MDDVYPFVRSHRCHVSTRRDTDRVLHVLCHTYQYARKLERETEKWDRVGLRSQQPFRLGTPLFLTIEFVRAFTDGIDFDFPGRYMKGKHSPKVCRFGI